MDFLKRVAADLKKNYLLLILALVLAVVFWLYVTVQVYPTITTTIANIPITAAPTEYMKQKNLQIVNDYQKTVDITIEGKRFDVAKLNNENFVASLDLSSVSSAGTKTVPVEVTSISSECTIKDIHTPKATIVVEEIISREFDVVATAPDVSAAEGFFLDADGIQANPATVTLTGSASVLNKITRIEARSALTGEVTASHETAGEVTVYGANNAKIPLTDIEMSTEIISVNIPVYRQKELDLVFRLVNCPPNFDQTSLGFEISPKSIVLAVPDDSLDNQSELDIGVIDISDIRLNQKTIVPIPLPKGCKNLSGNVNAQITWDISNYGKLDYTIDNITVSNRPDGMDVSLITNEITITAIGPSEKLAQLTAADFFVTANLLGVSLREGSQDVPLTITIRGSNQTCWVTGSYKAAVYAYYTEDNTE